MSNSTHLLLDHYRNDLIPLLRCEVDNAGVVRHMYGKKEPVMVDGGALVLPEDQWLKTPSTDDNKFFPFHPYAEGVVTINRTTQVLQDLLNQTLNKAFCSMLLSMKYLYENNDWINKLSSTDEYSWLLKLDYTRTAKVLTETNIIQTSREGKLARIKPLADPVKGYTASVGVTFPFMPELKSRQDKRFGKKKLVDAEANGLFDLWEVLFPGSSESNFNELNRVAFGVKTRTAPKTQSLLNTFRYLIEASNMVIKMVFSVAEEGKEHQLDESIDYFNISDWDRRFKLSNYRDGIRKIPGQSLNTKKAIEEPEPVDEVAEYIDERTYDEVPVEVTEQPKGKKTKIISIRDRLRDRGESPPIVHEERRPTRVRRERPVREEPPVRDRRPPRRQREPEIEFHEPNYGHEDYRDPRYSQRDQRRSPTIGRGPSGPSRHPPHMTHGQQLHPGGYYQDGYPQEPPPWDVGPSAHVPPEVYYDQYNRPVDVYGNPINPMYLDQPAHYAASAGYHQPMETKKPIGRRGR